MSITGLEKKVFKTTQIPPLSSLEKLVISHFEDSLAENLALDTNSEKLPVHLAFMTLAMCFREVRTMLNSKALSYVVSRSNIDVFALEYSVYCLARCTIYITRYSTLVSREDKKLLGMQLFAARHSLSVFYARFYPQDLVQGFIKDSAYCYLQNEEGLQLPQNELLTRIEKYVVGRKNFCTTRGEEFDFSAGVELGAYVVGRDQALFNEYNKMVDMIFRGFLNKFFWIIDDEDDEKL